MAELAAMEKAAAGFGQVLEAVRRALADLDRDLQASLVRWDGDAARAYRTAHGEWKAAAHDMAEQLAALRKVITTAHAHYHVSLDTNVTMWDVV
ncbi:hypothetical protein GCM10029978_110440 [Actinoallomurus acanthiterrae]